MIEDLEEIVETIRIESENLDPKERVELWEMIQDGFCPDCGEPAPIEGCEKC